MDSSSQRLLPSLCRCLSDLQLLVMLSISRFNFKAFSFNFQCFNFQCMACHAASTSDSLPVMQCEPLGSEDPHCHHATGVTPQASQVVRHSGRPASYRMAFEAVECLNTPSCGRLGMLMNDCTCVQQTLDLNDCNWATQSYISLSRSTVSLPIPCVQLGPVCCLWPSSVHAVGCTLHVEGAAHHHVSDSHKRKNQHHTQ